MTKLVNDRTQASPEADHTRETAASNHTALTEDGLPTHMGTLTLDEERSEYTGATHWSAMMDEARIHPLRTILGSNQIVDQ